MSRRKNFRHRAVDAPRVQRVQDGLVNFAAKLGMGADNQISKSSYDFSYLTNNPTLLEAMYTGSWVCGAAVDIIAEDMTKNGITLSGSIEPDEISAMQKTLDEKGVFSSLTDLIKWGRLYGGAIAVIDILGQDLSTPLKIETVSRGQFQGLVVYDRWRCSPNVLDYIPSGADAGLPLYYSVTTANAQFQNVHASRVIRAVGTKLPYRRAVMNSLWGASVLERVYDRLVAFDSAFAGIASLANQAYLRVMKIDQFREVLATGGEAEEAMIRSLQIMRLAQGSTGITAMDKLDDFSTTAYNFSGIDALLLQMGQQIAGAFGIPLVRLFGQAPAGLNSTGEADFDMYYGNIKALQESVLKTGLTKLLKIVHQSDFAKPVPQDFGFEFAPLDTPDQKQTAETAAINTNTIIAAQQAGIISDEVALKELKQQSAQTNIFTNISQIDIDNAAEVDPPIPELINI